MGNNSTKETRPQSRNDNRNRTLDQEPSHSDADATRTPLHAQRGSRGRHEGAFLGLVGTSTMPDTDARKETRQERDARRARKEATARLHERERSLREENVDGGYLVTLGTYTGPEDFSKTTVRQLMVERRIAPFWRGLNEHSDAWTEYQLVAAARGLPIPAPDEIPADLTPQSSRQPPKSLHTKPIPIQSDASGRSANSASLPGNPTLSSSSGTAAISPLFRGRSKTLASLTSKNNSEAELTPQEIQLPHEPQVNGQPVEANLYKDVLECPICFLYYPPYLNQTRCCDQPVCSECFVQIKRPDPHPPEHLDPNSPVPEDIRRLEEEGQLVSEPACCPFCVQSDFGVTYEPPPFRRGLAYSNMAFPKSTSAYSSSLHPPANRTALGPRRRRGQSMSAAAPGVITTDKVRPDWATKLSDARAQAARRSAAATALHNAAYMMDGTQSRLAFGRRRRQFMVDANGGERMYGGQDGISIPNMEMLMAALGDPGSSRGRRNVNGESGTRFSSRSSRADEIEEIMMMEAIRQSLAAEEDRRKREDKDSAKKAKKEAKQKSKDQAKEQKAAEKASRKPGPYLSSRNASSMLSNQTSASGDAVSPEEGKGKGRAHASAYAALGPSTPAMLGFNPLSDPTSTLDSGASGQSSKGALIDHSEHNPLKFGRHSPDASSSGSSFNGSGSSSLEDLPRKTGTQQPSLTQTQFSSLAEIIGESGVDGTLMLTGSDANERGPSHGVSRPNAPSSTGLVSTRENHRPVVEGRYDSKHHEDFPSTYGSMPHRDVS